MADITKWGIARDVGLPANIFYTIPTGGAKPNIEYEKPNTYLATLGAQREVQPPVGWDDQPAKLAMSPNMLNDPAFSEYDFSNIRNYEQDPRLRDEIALGIVGTKSASDFAKSPDLHKGTAGFTYPKGFPGNYDPNKVYVKNLDDLKMAVGPDLVAKTKQGNINKEIASTIAHEFRHNLLDQPEYSGIIDDLYNKFDGTISRFDLEEYVNRAADVQLMPESWLQGTLDSFQKNYNRSQAWTGRPEHLSPINTTAQFNQAARKFFEKVRREKLKRPTQINIQKAKMSMPEHLTHGGANVIPTPRTPISVPVPAHIRDGGGRPDKSGATGSRAGGFTNPGKGSYGPHMAYGGLMDTPLPGRRRDI